MTTLNVDERLCDFYSSTDSQNGEEAPVIPLTVAVTGARDIDSESLEAVRRSIHEFFIGVGEYWQKQNGACNRNKTAAPILVLDGLAAGTDSLAAETVLQLKKERPDLHFRLAAVLPMPKKIYEEDFSTPAEKERFHRLFTAADAHLEIMPDSKQKNVGRNSDVSLSPEERKRQYELLGEYLAFNSQLMLAVWDGENITLKNGCVPDEKRGGTAHVVLMKTEGITFCPRRPGTEGPAEELGSTQVAGPVFQIFAPRTGSPASAAHKAGQTFLLSPNDWRYPDKQNEEKNKRVKAADVSEFFHDKAVQKLCGRLSDINRDARNKAPVLRETRQQSHQWLLGERNEQDQKDHRLKLMLDHYTMYDALALYFQKRFYRFAAVYLGFILVFSLLFCLHAYLTPSYWRDFAFCGPLLEKGLRITYLSFFLVVVIMWFIYRVLSYYERFHRYRALAEALRVQIFWYLAGLEESAADHYKNHQIGALDWLRHVMRTLLLPVTTRDQPDLERVRIRWVKDQYLYFKKMISRYRHADKRYTGIQNLPLWVFCLLWLVVRIFPHEIQDSLAAPDKASCLPFVSIGFIILGMSGMVIFVRVLWNRLKSNGSLANRYSKIYPIYVHALRLLSEVDEEESLSEEAKIRSQKHILRQLGEFALGENADWFLISRKLELPR